MMKTLRTLVISAVFFAMMSGAVFAADVTTSVKFGTSAWALFIGAGLAIGLAALGCGIGMGNAINGALEGTSRNPSAASSLRTLLLIGLALIESLAIYALVVALILVMVI